MPRRVTIASFAALAVPGLLALGSGCSWATPRAPLPAARAAGPGRSGESSERDLSVVEPVAAGARVWVVTGRAVASAPEPEGVPLGSVAEETFLPAQGARVTLEADPECACDSPGVIEPRSVTAGVDGRFRVGGVPGGAAVRVSVERDGTAVRTIRLETPHVVEDLELDVGDVLLDPAFSLRIRLVDEGDRAVEGAKAIALRDGRYRRGPSSTVACGESRREARALGGGEYLFERLAPGDFGLFAEEGDLVAWIDDGIHVPREDPLVVTMRPGCRFSGTVVSSDGRPIEGARVRERDFPVSVRTDASSRFSIVVPCYKWAEGGTALRASAAGFCDSAWQSPDDEGDEDMEFRLFPEAVVSGRVVSGRTRGPIQGAEVRVSGEFVDSLWYSAATDAEGRFEVRGLPPGECEISAEHPRHVPVDGEPLVLEVGQRLEGIELRLEEAAALEGRVVDAITKGVVTGASMCLHARDSPQPPFWSTRTGRGGTFTVGAPRTGGCTIEASAPGYASSALDLDSAVGPVTVELVPDPRASIAGRVLDPDGHPGPWARVRLESPEWRSPADVWAESEQGTMADASGRFALRGISNVEGHAVVAELEGFAPARLDGVKLAAPRRIDGLELRLRRGATIRGRIVEEVNGAIAGAYVRAEARSPGEAEVGPSGSKVPRRIWADSAPDGTYVLRHIEPGTWVVSPEAPGRHDLAGRAVEVADGEEVAVDWTFPVGETVSGSVVDDAGTPLRRVNVWLTAGDPASPAGARTDPDGRFEFRGIGKGTVSIAASRRPFRADERSVEVPGPEVVLRLGRPARIRGRIEARGLVRFDPMSDVEVGARDDGSGRRFRVDPTGHFRATVEPGDRWLATDVPGFARAWVELRLEPGAERDVLLPLEPGGSLEGFVIEGGSGRAAAHARVRVVEAGGRRPPEHLWSGSADGSGDWRIDDVPAGTVRLEADDRGYARTRVHGIAVAAGHTTRVNIVLREGTGVMGRVERGGAPVRGALVEVRPSDGSPIVALTTDGGGLYEADDLTPGTYEIVGRDPALDAGRDRAQAARTVTVREGTYEWAFLDLSPAGGE